MERSGRTCRLLIAEPHRGEVFSRFEHDRGSKKLRVWTSSLLAVCSWVGCAWTPGVLVQVFRQRVRRLLQVIDRDRAAIFANSVRCPDPDLVCWLGGKCPKRTRVFALPIERNGAPGRLGRPFRPASRRASA
jgi:hypothetical protein